MSTLFFGLIHGLGFAREFTMLVGKAKDKLLPLLEFALGIEIAQVIVVIGALCIAYLFQKTFNLPKRYWELIISSIIIVLTIPMILGSELLDII
jgi:predicted membrane protein